MEDLDFLKNLKVGDEIILQHGYGTTMWFEKKKISRETKCYFFVEREVGKFHKKNGHEAGDFRRILENNSENKKLLNGRRK